MCTTPCSVFISYNHFTKTLAEDLHRKLEADGFQVVRDVHVDFTENFTDFMKQIRKTDFVLLLINEYYLKSINCMFEITEMLKDDEYKKRILPLVAEDTKFYRARQITHYIEYWEEELKKLENDEKNLPLQSKSVHITEAKRIARILLDLADFLNDLQVMSYEVIPLDSSTIPINTYQIIKDRIRQDQIRKKGTLKPLHWNIPYQPNPFFTGRDDIIETLRKSLKLSKSTAISQVQAISGLGGIGKTQIAIEYAYRYKSEYDAMLWVVADTTEALNSSFVALAKVLNLPQKDEKEQATIINAVKEWLQQNSSWLLVFDNADAPQILEPYIPLPVVGHIILTSRASVFDSLYIGHPILIDKMKPDDAYEFLSKRTSRENINSQESTALNKIVKELDYLPVALEQAGAYIVKLKCSFVDYLTSFTKKRVKLLKEDPIIGRSNTKTAKCPQSILTTWSMNFEQVEQISKASADILRASAFLSPDAIPFEIFTDGAENLGLEFAKSVDSEDPLSLNTLLEPITQYSLVRINPETKTFTIHRLVQEVIRYKLDEPQKRVWLERVVNSVNKAIPSKIEFSNWSLCNRLLPHMFVCDSYIKDWTLESGECGRLLNQAGSYLHVRGQYAEAEPLYQRALKISEKRLGPNHPDVASGLNNLASLFCSQGKYTESKSLYQRALKILEDQLGPNHPGVALCLNNQASLLDSQGKYTESESLYQRALKILEEQLGPNHPDVALSLNNIAELFRSQGKYTESEPLYQRALKIREEQLGPNHPCVATSLNNLALLFHSQGNFAEAAPLFQRALKIREEQLGLWHPDVAQSLNNSALLFCSQGKYTEAEPLYQRALKIWEEQLGPNHPDVATSLDNLAGLFCSQRKYTEAKPLIQRALKIRKEQLGLNHPDVAQSLNSSALLFCSQGKYTEAEPLYQRALKIREEQLGPNHPDVATSLNNLAGLYCSQRKYIEAEPLFQRALKILEQQLGLDHLNTVNVRENLNYCLKIKGHRKF